MNTYVHGKITLTRNQINTSDARVTTSWEETKDRVRKERPHLFTEEEFGQPPQKGEIHEFVIYADPEHRVVLISILNFTGSKAPEEEMKRTFLEVMGD